MASIPNYYQPNSDLFVQTDQEDLSVEVVRVFTPFTFSQVLVVRTDRATESMCLPAGFLLILKVYDPRFNLKARLSLGHPWTYDAEAEAARNRKPIPDFDLGEFPHRPDDEEEDPVRIDFGGSALRWGESDEEWDSCWQTQADAANLWSKLRGKLKGHDLTNFPELVAPPE